MSAQSEEDIILKLILKGQDESEILDHLKKHDMIDDLSVYRVQSKIREMRAARNFLPRRPPRIRIRFFGLVLIFLGAAVTYFFADSSIRGFEKYNPSGAALMLIVIGVILVIWPDKGTESL